MPQQLKLREANVHSWPQGLVSKQACHFFEALAPVEALRSE